MAKRVTLRSNMPRIQGALDFNKANYEINFSADTCNYFGDGLTNVEQTQHKKCDRLDFKKLCFDLKVPRNSYCLSCASKKNFIFKPICHKKKYPVQSMSHKIFHWEKRVAYWSSWSGKDYASSRCCFNFGVRSSCASCYGC